MKILEPPIWRKRIPDEKTIGHTAKHVGRPLPFSCSAIKHPKSQTVDQGVGQRKTGGAGEPKYCHSNVLFRLKEHSLKNLFTYLEGPGRWANLGPLFKQVKRKKKVHPRKREPRRAFSLAFQGNSQIQLPPWITTPWGRGPLISVRLNSNITETKTESPKGWEESGAREGGKS